MVSVQEQALHDLVVAFLTQVDELAAAADTMTEDGFGVPWHGLDPDEVLDEMPRQVTFDLFEEADGKIVPTRATVELTQGEPRLALWSELTTCCGLPGRARLDARWGTARLTMLFRRLDPADNAYERWMYDARAENAEENDLT